MSTLILPLRTQTLTADARGWAVWQTNVETHALPADAVALILCDVWDGHWSRGAAERVDLLAPRINAAAAAARAAGVHIIHAPSETLDFYAGTPARERMVQLPRVPLPPLTDHADPPLPIDDHDGGSDTGETPWWKAWTRQHPAVEIDHDRDGIADDGAEVYAYLAQHAIRQVIIMGVHTNMCVLNRSFGIKALVRRGVPVALVADLTDTMYNPARPPYVSHDEGTRLVVDYIEKFWCPTITSEVLLG